MAAESARARRTASREARREQLIDATMKCIGRKGLGSMTLADVANEAGLSQGIVNLHFQSKDNLLTETLKTLANDYQAKFERTLARSGPHPAEKIQALMELDLKPSVCDRGPLTGRSATKSISTTTTSSSSSARRSSMKANTRA